MALVDGPQESLKCPVGSRQARDDFRDPHYGNLVSIHFGLDSGVTHRFATAAENLSATQANFQSGGELGSVNIAGPLPSHHQQTIFSHVSGSGRGVLCAPPGSSVKVSDDQWCLEISVLAALLVG